MRRVDRSTISADFDAYLTADKIGKAQKALNALGKITNIRIAGVSERGGLEVASVRFNVGTTAAQDRTTATIVLFSVGAWVLAVLAQPWTRWRRTMVVSVVAAFAFALAVPQARDVLAMELPPASVILAVTIVALAARPLLAMALRLARWTPYDAPT